MLPRMQLLHTAYVPAGEGPFPTILALHGWGANAQDLLGLAPFLHGGEALVVCPEGPVAFEIQQGYVGHGWFPIRSGRPRIRRSSRAARSCCAAFSTRCCAAIR